MKLVLYWGWNQCDSAVIQQGTFLRTKAWICLINQFYSAVLEMFCFNSQWKSKAFSLLWHVAIKHITYFSIVHYKIWNFQSPFPQADTFIFFSFFQSPLKHYGVKNISKQDTGDMVFRSYSIYYFTIGFKLQHCLGNSKTLNQSIFRH